MVSLQMTNHSDRPSLLTTSDSNNNEILPSDSTRSSTTQKKRKSVVNGTETKTFTIGQIKEVRMINFMCHKNFEIRFHPTPMQIVTGANGSGQTPWLSIHERRFSSSSRRKIDHRQCDLSLFGCASAQHRPNGQRSVVHSKRRSVSSTTNDFSNSLRFVRSDRRNCRSPWPTKAPKRTKPSSTAKKFTSFGKSARNSRDTKFWARNVK